MNKRTNLFFLVAVIAVATCCFLMTPSDVRADFTPTGDVGFPADLSLGTYYIGYQGDGSLVVGGGTVIDSKSG